MTMMNYDFVYHETPIDILARKAGFSMISMDENQPNFLLIPMRIISVSIQASLARRKCVTKRPLLDSSSHFSQLLLGLP